MLHTAAPAPHGSRNSALDRLLSLVADVRPGERATAVLMLVNIALLLVCDSLIKIVRLSVDQFAVGNIALTLVWLIVAFLIVRPDVAWPRVGAGSLARVAAAGAAAVLLTATPAFAQEGQPQLRDEMLAGEQARKATQLHQYEPDALERRLGTIDRALQLLSGPVYPFIGSAMDGGGVTFGPGFRGRTGATGTFDVHAGISMKGYRTADATLVLPAFAHRRLTVELRGTWLDAPEVTLYDIGNGSARGSATDFSLGQATVGVTTRFRAARGMTIGAALDWIVTDTTPSTASRLADASPTYRRTRLLAEVDTRTSPGYTRRGALYRLEAADYRQTNGRGYSFRRLDAEARQFIPLFRENWVVALRALASTTSTAGQNDVPYFLMPELGGGHWLRGYPSWRFRDRNRLLVSAEYRWTAGSFVDMSLFVDAGRVAARAGDLTAGGVKKTYGVGLSLHTLASTLTRIELARTPEGSSLVLSFGPSF
jgi:hypothetical protein